jgi:hypothetical protein
MMSFKQLKGRVVISLVILQSMAETPALINLDEGEAVLVQASTIPVREMEPNASAVPAVRVMHIACTLCPELPAVCQSVL